jgi:anti-sigma B factor antagonist
VTSISDRDAMQRSARARAGDAGACAPDKPVGVVSDLMLEQIDVGRRVVLAVAGEVDIDSAGAIPAAVDDALDSGAHDVWVDLTDVTFMDSSGVHALIVARTRVRELERSLVVICPPGNVRRLLAVTGLDGALELYDTREQAHRSA